MKEIKFEFNNMFANCADTYINKANIDKFSHQAKIAFENVIKNPQKDTKAYFDVLYKDTLKIKEYAKELKVYENVVVLGIGGSALGAKAIYSALESCLPHQPRLYVKDEIDPEQFSCFLKHIDVTKSFFIIATKSGSTIEVLCLTNIVESLLQQRVGENFYRHFCLITANKHCALTQWASQNNIKTIFFSNDLSGRFSALSVVGLLPLATCGINVDNLQCGARDMFKICSNDDIGENPALYGALLQMLAIKSGKNISCLMPYAENLSVFSEWYCQLWAESLGKEKVENGQLVHFGQTPVRAIGTIDQHSLMQLCLEGPFDKVITFIKVEQFKNDLTIGDTSYLPKFVRNKSLTTILNTCQMATEKALFERGRISRTIKVPAVNEYYLGEIIMFFFLETSFACELLKIDAYNQPSVEFIKSNIKHLLNNEEI